MLKQIGPAIERRYDKELLRIEPWGKGLRVRATERREFLPEEIGALLPKELEGEPEITIEGEEGRITYGKITCRILDNGELKFYNDKNETIL